MSKKRRAKSISSPGSKHKRHKSAESLSINLLKWYVALLGLFYVTFLIYPQGMLFGIELIGFPALLLNLLFVILLGCILYGVKTRKHWAWHLTLAWFGFEILNSIVSSILVSKSSVMSDFVNIASVYVILLNAIILWYVIAKKDYFFKKNYVHRLHIVDKVFVVGVSVFVVLLIVLVSTSAVSIYLDTTYISKQIVGEVNGMSLDQALLYCEGKSAQQKDVCYIVVGVVFDEAPPKICDEIEFGFYKATCLKATK